MAIAVLLAGGLFHGDAGDGSVLAIFLIGGALLGAAGRRPLGVRQAPRLSGPSRT